MADRRSSIAYAALCAALVFCWQLLTVRYNYQGRWTALFYTGAYGRTPPALDFEKIYTVRDSAGYDGQFYHYVAHDPLLRHGFSRFVDNPRLRWRRILVPGLAFLAAAGRPRGIDSAFYGVTLVFLFLGAYWLSRYCCHYGWHPAWGLCFALVPAVMVSIDRLTIDVAVAALCVAFALYGTVEASWKVYPVLALAPLARETGLILILAYGLFELGRRQWRRALVVAATAAPFLAWLFFLQQRTRPDLTVWASWRPLAGLLARTLHPVQYAVSGRWLAAAAVTDYLAVLGIWLGFALALALIWRRRLGPVEIAAAAFAAFLMFLAKPDIWSEAYAFGRTLSPLLVLVALAGIAARSWWDLLPLGMVAPRIGLQILTQVPGVVMGLSGAR